MQIQVDPSVVKIAASNQPRYPYALGGIPMLTRYESSPAWECRTRLFSQEQKTQRQQHTG